MSAMSNPFIKWPVVGVVGLVVLGVPALGVSLASTTVNGYGESAGIIVTVLPDIATAFNRGQDLAGKPADPAPAPPAQKAG